MEKQGRGRIEKRKSDDGISFGRDFFDLQLKKSLYLCKLKYHLIAHFMRRFFILITTLIVLVNYVAAQRNITIKGTLGGGAGKRVELYRYSDKISRAELLLDTCRVGENQKFELHCYANYPILVFLQVDDYSQSFYVEPGRTYNTLVEDFDWYQDEHTNVFLEPVTLPLQFLNLPEDDINLLIDSMDRTVNQYLVEHREVFDQRFRPQPRYFDSLMLYVEKRCPDIEGRDFFNRYKRYSLAEMGLDMRMISRKNIFRQYIQGQPVLCYDENYMSLFTALYANAISRGTKANPIHRVAHWVYNLDLDTYIDSIGMDSLLRHEQVRELAALLALKESYYNFRYYNDTMVVKMVEAIAQRTKFVEHKAIAANLIASFRSMEAGSEMKSFYLPDVQKNLVPLDTFAGHWVYLAFVRVDDPNCISELETMAHFLDTVYRSNDSIEFLTIVCDRDFQKMYHFLRNSKVDDQFDWTWLHFDGKYDCLSQFGVCSYPHFALLDPNGRLYYQITPAPSTGFLLSPPWSWNVSDKSRKSFLQHYKVTSTLAE